MILDKIKKDVVKQINQALKKEIVSAADLVFPPNPEMGDLSLPCFGLSKSFKKSPVETAEFLVGKIKTDKFIRLVKTAGPYLNFVINQTRLTTEVIKEIEKVGKDYGANKAGKKKRVMIEYSNANTHKEYHIGHLRNIAYGDSVNRILSANGFEVLPASYINDFGIHVAKTLWCYTKHHSTEAEIVSSKGYFLGQLYVEATKRLDEEPDLKTEVGEIMKQIESRKGEVYKLWQETRKWSIEQFKEIYKELKVAFKATFYESEVIDEGFKIVADLYEKHFLVKSQGAVIANLEPYGLGALLFLRTDGTALYPVADLPLAMLKFKKYKLDQSIIVVDIRQSLYFDQLFKVLELLGYKKPMMHLGYDFVKLPEGMMSSRTGRIITYEELKTQMVARAVEETYAKHENWEAETINLVAKKIALSAMKFEMIKVGRDKTITFDLEKALRFDGFTSAYLQYTYARIGSILRKSGVRPKDYLIIDAAKLTEAKERILVLKLAKYPHIVELAGQTYEPSEIAKYLFELAQSFNDYYHEVPVLKAEAAVMLARLALLRSVRQALVNGFALLGLETIEEM